jgi:hypothetical protein
MNEDVVTLVENRVFDEIRVGDTARMRRTMRMEDITLFSIISGLATSTQLTWIRFTPAPIRFIISSATAY